MRLGALLVLIGILLIVIDFALDHAHHDRYRTGLLHAGAILIGIGALVGNTVLNTGH